MAHQIGKRHSPRRGSMAYWPRKRAKRIYPRIKNWGTSNQTSVLGFAAYKAGMTHIMINDNRKHSPTKNMEISVPATILETPSLNVIALKFYKNQKTINQIFSDKLDKKLKRKILLPKKKETKTVEDCDEVRLLVSTNPSFKKTPEIFELGIGGKNIQEKMVYAKELLGKQININDVFKEGEQIDTIAITKGKGFQGSVKRFGVAIMQAKSEKTKRAAGTIGHFTPARTRHTTPQFGQMGFHRRTEYNKWVLKIGEADITPKSGFKNYGQIKGKYLLVKGSVQGPRKRLIMLRKPVRQQKQLPPPEINEVIQ
ncbi:MAG: 50S ribosomal protein L3 [Nanoarchaeota archaeon]|nr:50S ribosomal protein L3 [Nanoarchaeota archaeon]